MIALVVMAVQAQSICLQIVPKKHLYLMKTGGEVGMKLYRKYIRPMHCYPGQHYEPKTELVEKEEKWYPEEEREHLEEKYGYLNEGHFSDLIFEEKYEPCLLKEQEAKWVEDKQGERCRLIKCSNCGLTFIVGNNIPYDEWIEDRNYCRRYGARMEGR